MRARTTDRKDMADWGEIVAAEFDAPQTIPSDEYGEPVSRFSSGVALSLLFHLGVAAAALLSGWGRTFPEPTARPMQVTYIDLRTVLPDEPKPRKHAEPPSIPESKIVSPSDAPELPPDAATARLSERNSKTDRETIKRGEGATPESKSAPPPPKPSRPTPPPPERPPTKVAPAKAPAAEHPVGERPLRDPLLRLDPEQIASAINRATPAAEPVKQEPEATSLLEPRSKLSDPERQQRFRNNEPFKSSLLSELTSGRAGSPDYLPKVQDGDVTLLNAKADRHAVFVRRVAMQVFGALRRASWQELSFAEVHRIRGFVKVEGVMSKAGALIEVKLRESSGSDQFDRLVVRAVEQSVSDQNPPHAAVSDDGSIHFIFESRTWARGAQEGMREQRWLLLGTGLL